MTVVAGQWIRRLHACGLLAGSFRPSDDIVVLRGYLRQRQTLIADAGRHVQHTQKALEQMNVKLTEVVSDVVGTTADHQGDPLGRAGRERAGRVPPRAVQAEQGRPRPGAGGHLA
jgi:hypothetical protein